MHILIALFTYAATSFAANAPYCQNLTLPHGETLNYCVVMPPVAEPRKVLYYMHGLGGSARDVLNSELSEDIEQLFTRTGQNAPAVVALDFGPSAIINSTKAQDLANFAMPKIESLIGAAAGAERHLIGASLGGFNALNFAAAHPRLFHSIEALCPALINFDPFDSQAADKYIYRNVMTAKPQLVAMMVNQLRQNYLSEKVWQKNNPLNAAKAGRYSGVDLFLSVGLQDDYGFQEGAQAFYRDLPGGAGRREFMPVNGGHCSFDIPGLLNFLSGEMAR